MKYKFFIIIFLTINITNLFAADSDTLWNQTDNKGKKQGNWRANYENGKLKYSGYFKDNKPVGEMKRFHENGALKALMILIKMALNQEQKYSMKMETLLLKVII